MDQGVGKFERREAPLPSGLRPTIRQVLIFILWAALIMAAGRTLAGWGLLGSSVEDYCMNIAIHVASLPMCLLGMLILVLDRRGSVRSWYVSWCIGLLWSVVAATALILQDLVCYLLTGRPTVTFPLMPCIGLFLFWAGFKQWRLLRPKPCGACGQWTIIPNGRLAHPGRPWDRRAAREGWCATCGALYERVDLAPWQAKFAEAS